MAQKRKPDQRKVIANAALSLAAARGWEALTLKDVAKKSRVPVDAVLAIFSDTWDILLHILQAIDEQALADRPQPGPWRDTLFELLMNRFDLLEKNKKSFADIPSAFSRHPKAALKCAKPFLDSMQGLLAHAGAPSSPLHTAAFGGLYLFMQDAWQDDDTPDLSKTMAEVDRRLGQFERAAGYLPCPRGL